MQTFTDNLGQVWTLRLTIAAMSDIKDLLRIDLMNPVDQRRLMASWLDRMRIIHVLCSAQGDALKLKDHELEDRLHGEGVAAAAGDALLQELADFSLRFGEEWMAETLTKSIETMNLAREKNKEFIRTGGLSSVLQKEQDQVLSGLHDLDGNSLTNLSPSAEESTGET